ncbi:hypothetical protein H6P81_014372 [Aristolochia fimbriata]|uniref:Uncharacterized protein n=1 Tax=Aristolochia fimbriata TaxID=158543 RepID=A0AAV7EHN6_ARIFI|nr:hypothetical protein H6P81_014372 [Aristolochia fimbriata]
MVVCLPIPSIQQIFSPNYHVDNRKLLHPCSLKISTSCSSSLREPILGEDSASSGISKGEDATPKDEEEQFPLGCKACGRAEIENGCNGEGRIQGGIGTVPGFGWWPIKAYRPCPGFVASGGRYKRVGQSMDEVAFGREGPKASSSFIEKDQPSKKEGSPRRFKR